DTPTSVDPAVMPAKIMCATGWNMFVISSISPPRWEAAVASQSAKHFFNGNAEWLLNRYVAAIVERDNARKRARRSRWFELSHRKWCSRNRQTRPGIAAIRLRISHSLSELREPFEAELAMT